MLDRIAPDRPFCGLWSLWDMLELKAIQFAVSIRAITALESFIMNWDEKKRDQPIGDGGQSKSRVDLLTRLGELAEACQVIDAPVTQITALELIRDTQRGEITWRRLGEDASQLRRNLERELSSSRVFALNRDDARYFDGALAMFGEGVLDAFPTTASEIDEAGKCLALGRTSAAIFHLMRVCEIALRSLAEPLAITDPQPSWNTVIRKLDKETKKEPKDRSLQVDYAFLEGVSNQMHAVNRAWRTNAMHVDATFSLENARDIFSATKSLMQHLAAGGLCEPVAAASPPSETLA